jgi:hypothetical protein
MSRVKRPHQPRTFPQKSHGKFHCVFWTCHAEPDEKEKSALKMIKAVTVAQHHRNAEAPLLQETGERLFEAMRATAPRLACPSGETGMGAFQPNGAINA